jgi:hypothetical protein
MRTLQITLFLIANVIFLSQAGRNVHHLIFSAEGSVLDQFEPEKQHAKAEPNVQTLLADYKKVSEEIETLEKGKKSEELLDVRQQHSSLYSRKDALRREIAERESKTREIRDLWIYCGYGLFLIALGAYLYRRSQIWSGFSIVVAGFCILEFWASPSFFGDAAVAEFRQLLWSKTILTFIALGLLYALWRTSAVLTQDRQFHRG